jgi:hypothetical protein
MRVASERPAVPEDSKRTPFGTVPQRLTLASLEEVRGLTWPAWRCDQDYWKVWRLASSHTPTAAMARFTASLQAK